MENINCAQAPKMTKINGDQEIWLREKLIRLVNLTTEIKNSNTLDKEMVELAIEGAINGQALSILQILNLEPEYTNLPKRTWWFSDSKRKGAMSTSIGLNPLGTNNTNI